MGSRPGPFFPRHADLLPTISRPFPPYLTMKSNCGRTCLQRTVVGVWNCKHCNKTKAGGAYTYNTAASVTVRSTIRRLREQIAA